MEHTSEELKHVLDDLSNPSWPHAEVQLGHGVWWNNDLVVSKLQQAVLAVLYATVPLSYPEFYRIIHDVQCVASVFELAGEMSQLEVLDDEDMRSACRRLRNQISEVSLAEQAQVHRYVYETIGLGRRSLITNEFIHLFSRTAQVRYEGESETQEPVKAVLPETYSGYSFQALGTYEYNLLAEVAGSGTYLEGEVWCLTKPSAVNVTLGCNLEGERVKLPPQLLSWNTVNAMYPYLGVSVAGDTGVVAYACTKRFDNMDRQNLEFFKPGEGIYFSKSNSKPPAVRSVYFGGSRVECGLLNEDHGTDFGARVESISGDFHAVREWALMWQKVYQFELDLGSGACIARRQSDPRFTVPLIIPLSAISKEVLPNLFCEETLCVARELARARKDYYFDFSKWPFLFVSPQSLQQMLVAVLYKDGGTNIHSDDESDSCVVIRRSITEKADVRGKAKALVDCLSILYRRIDQKISEESRNGNDNVLEYYGDTAMWAVLNALAPLELVYFGKGHAFLENSVIISNAVQKASTCVAFIENLKREIDNNTLDLGIMKFLAHAAIVLDVVKSVIVHGLRDGSCSVLAMTAVTATVDKSQVNIRWANRDRIKGLGNLLSKSEELSKATGHQVYKAMLKSGLVGTWEKCTGEKKVETINVGLWNIETFTLLYDDTIRVKLLGDVVEVSGVGQRTANVKRELFVNWKEKRRLVEQFLEEVEETKGIPGPTCGIWEVVLRWQKDMELQGVEKKLSKELLANAIVLSAVATGRLVETPVLTSQISIVRKYIAGKTFLLWNGNAHREVKGIPDTVDIPIELVVNGGAHPGLRMVSGDFAKQLTKSHHGTVVGKVVDISESASSLRLNCPPGQNGTVGGKVVGTCESASSLFLNSAPGRSHEYNYSFSSSRLRQHTAHDASLVLATFLTAASDGRPSYKMNDLRLGLLVDPVRTYETQNSLVVLSHVDEHGNLKVRISGKTTSTNTRGTQENLSVGSPSLVGASGSLLQQHAEQMETNVDHELIISSFSALRNALRSRAKSKETSRGLGAVASAIIVQQIAVDRAVRYERGSNGCWGIVRRLWTESEGLKEQPRDKGQNIETDGPLAAKQSEGLREQPGEQPSDKGRIIEIDGPLAAKKDTAFQLVPDKKTHTPLLKIMIDRGQFIVFRGLFLIENGDDADVVRMRLRADGDAWIESYPSGQHTGERCRILPYSIEIG